jgi:hypothetical protein
MSRARLRNIAISLIDGLTGKGHKSGEIAQSESG